MDNTKRRAKFLELANKRVPSALKAISLIGNLSNQSNYLYSKADLDKIFKSIDSELDSVRRRFETKDNGSGPQFKLE